MNESQSQPIEIRSKDIRMVSLADIKLNPANANTHPEEQVAMLVELIKYQGFRVPGVISNRSGLLAAGEGRYLAAKRLGMASMPCTFQDFDDEAQETAFGTSDNLSALQAAMDFGRVKELALKMPEGFDLKLMGLTDMDLKKISLDGGKEEEEATPEPPKIAKTSLGEMWILGSHRLLCGDCTKKEDVEALVAGEKAVLMNTDPPYGVSYTTTALSQEDSKWEEIENDHLRDKELQEFLTKAFKNASEIALVDSAAWYLWHAHLTQGFFAAAAAAAAANVILHRQIIWVKQQLILGRGMFHWKHEPCFMGWREGHRPAWYGDRSQTTTWDLGARELDRVHPTQKPVSLFEGPIIFHSQPGEVVYEPFSGSGSQLIAAEKLGRRCFGLELSPSYIDVILERWATFTGKDPVRIDGMKWSQLKAS